MDDVLNRPRITARVRRQRAGIDQRAQMLIVDPNGNSVLRRTSNVRHGGDRRCVAAGRANARGGVDRPRLRRRCHLDEVRERFREAVRRQPHAVQAFDQRNPLFACLGGGMFEKANLSAKQRQQRAEADIRIDSRR
ncbi:MAG: hypothetical protein IPK66_01885 [Rhodospirillales bacterium]|nr:hypothetical protein [Rhodospirillales bacterium]